MITHSDLRGIGVTWCEQCIKVTSHYTFLNSVHVAISTAKTRWCLRFFVYVKPFKTPMLVHCFITSLKQFSSISCSQTLSLLVRPLQTSNPNYLKVWFLIHDRPCFMILMLIVRIYGFKLEGVNCLKRVFVYFSALNEITSRKPWLRNQFFKT